MQEVPTVANVVVNEDYLKELVDQRALEFLEKHLFKNWYTRQDIKQKTGITSDEWIRDHIDNHPYVKEHKLKFTVSDANNAPPRYLRGIDYFLDNYVLLQNKEVTA